MGTLCGRQLLRPRLIYQYLLRMIGSERPQSYCTYVFFLRLALKTVFEGIEPSCSSSSSSTNSRLILVSSTSIFVSVTGADVAAALSPKLSASTLTVFTSIFAESLSEKARRSAVNRTLWAHPASLPHRLLKRSPTASYVALVRLLCFPLPNL